MAGEALRFIRVHGRVVPILAKGAGAAVAGRHALKAVKKTPSIAKPIKVNHGLRAFAATTAVASGVVGAAGFAFGLKGFLAAEGISHALGLAGAASNAASVAGRGHTKARVEQAAKQEARDYVLGYGVYGLGALAVPKSRKAIFAGAAKVIAFGKKFIR